MFTRRGILLASVAAGVAMNSKGVLGKAAQPSTPVNFDVPAGACDCHTHIHADPEKYPFFAGRSTRRNWRARRRCPTCTERWVSNAW